MCAGGESVHAVHDGRSWVGTSSFTRTYTFLYFFAPFFFASIIAAHADVDVAVAAGCTATTGSAGGGVGVFGGNDIYRRLRLALPFGLTSTSSDDEDSSSSFFLASSSHHPASVGRQHPCSARMQHLPCIRWKGPSVNSFAVAFAASTSTSFCKRRVGSACSSVVVRPVHKGRQIRDLERLAERHTDWITSLSTHDGRAGAAPS